MTGISRALFQPSELSQLRFPDFPGGTIEDVVGWMRAHEPRYLAALCADVRASGFTDRVEVVLGEVWDGHHRAAVAWILQVPLPVFCAPESGRYYPGYDARGSNDRGAWWRELRKGFPGEYEARMAHDPRAWGRRHDLAAKRKEAASGSRV